MHRRPKAAVALAALAVAMAFSLAAAASSHDQPALPQIKEKMATEQMQRHVNFLLIIAKELAASRYDKAAEIVDNEFGLGTRAGKRTGSAFDMEDTQALWEKGLEFRTAASLFAGHARIVHKNKSPEAKAALLDSFAKMINVCKECHQAFRDH